MASIGQMELWHSKARERIEKYKSLLAEETKLKKEFGRPKTPQQVKDKEAIVQRIDRYRDEFEFAKRKEKEWEAQLKEARKELKQMAPKSSKSVKKVLERKFNKIVPAPSSKTSDAKARQPKAKDNKIVLPSMSGSVDIEKVFSLLQDVMGKINGLEQEVKVLTQKLNTPQ